MTESFAEGKPASPAPPVNQASATPAAGSELPHPNPWFIALAGWEKALVAAFPLIFFLSLGRYAVGEQVHLSYELGWVFSFCAAILGPPFLAARGQALERILRIHTPSEPQLIGLYEDYRQTNEVGRGPFFMAFLSAALFIGFRITISWDILPYRFDVTRLVSVFVGSVGFGFFVRGLWLFFAFGSLISRLSNELERLQAKLFSWELLESAGKGYARTAIGAAVLAFSMFWMAVSTHQTFVGHGETLGEQLLYSLLIFLLAVGLPLVYLLLPLWRLHRLLAGRKAQIRELFASTLTRTEREFLRNPNRELAQNYLTERQLMGEINNLPEWPFKFETLAQLITLVAIPAGLFIFKEVLVNVLVELVKR